MEKDKLMLEEIEQMKADRQKILNGLIKDSENRVISEVRSSESKKKVQNTEEKNPMKFNEKYPVNGNGKTPKDTNKKEFDTISGNKFIYKQHITEDKPSQNISKNLSFDKLVKKKKSVAKELIDRQEEELTFKPKINKNPDYNNKEMKREGLFKDMREVWKKREEERIKIEQAEIEKN